MDAAQCKCSLEHRNRAEGGTLGTYWWIRYCVQQQQQQQSASSELSLARRRPVCLYMLGPEPNPELSDKTHVRLPQPVIRPLPNTTTAHNPPSLLRCRNNNRLVDTHTHIPVPCLQQDNDAELNWTGPCTVLNWIDSPYPAPLECLTYLYVAYYLFWFIQACYY